MTNQTTKSTLPFLVKACLGQQLERPPVWLMRQAGRYMKEYRVIRQKTDFLTLCKTPDLAAEVSLQPYHAFGMDAVIMFCDILIPPEAMGLTVTFGNGGPSIDNPVRAVSDIERLVVPDPIQSMGFVTDLLQRLRKALKDDLHTALIGFSGAPWTLATYMIEGGSSKNFAFIKGLMFENPKALHQLLEKIAETVILYLNAQIEAGAQIVQLFDTWAGILEISQYREFVLPYHQKIIDSLKKTGPEGDPVPVILYVNNSRGLLPCLAEAKPTVISLDTTTSITEARAILADTPFGTAGVLQGNIDPVALFSPPEALKPIVQDVLKAGKNTRHIVNLGHGILPPTPPENVTLLVDTVKNSAALF
ncbi:MAG: uroporphyrinogen decarboxylase [Cyanobacteria bacterium P01_H01_bin.74]